MATLKEQLDAAGYDTSNLNESDILDKLDKAGYDTSSLAKPQGQGNLSKAIEYSQKIYGNTLPGMIVSGYNKVSDLSGRLGQKTADMLTSKQGLPVPISPLTPIQAGNASIKTSPQVANVVSKAVGLAPDVVTAANMPTEPVNAALSGAYGGVKSMVAGLGRQAESLSGIAPKAEGALAAVANDASLLGAKGKAAVSQMYQAAKQGEKVIPEMLNMGNKKDFIAKAMELAQNDKLNPTSALEARKTLDEIRRTLPDPVYRAMKQKFDDIAKQTFAGSDAAYKRAVYAEALRNVLPQNKYGGASAFKLLLGKGLNAAALPALSPAVQGVTAAGLGILNKAINPMMTNPNTSRATTMLLLQALKSNKK